MSSPTKPPTIVMIPGAWHKQFHYQPFMDVVQQRGYSIQCIPLRNTHTELPRPTWEEEVSHIEKPIQNELDAGNDVCVLLHSYAGIPGSEALNRVVKADGLTKRLGKGQLVKVIYFAAFTFPAGFVVDAKMFEGPANPNFHISEDGMCHHSRPYEAFFHDMSREDAQPYVDQIKPYYYIPGGGQISTDDWKRIPRMIIGTTNDVAMPKERQEQMWAEYKDGIHWIDTGHTPFPAKPEHIADVVLSHLGQ